MSSMNLKMDKLTDLTGKVALITGGGTGVGLMIAKGFTTNGAKVYITGRRFDVLQKAAELKFEGAGSLVPLQMDVTVKESILSVVSKVKEMDGKLDILVNKCSAFMCPASAVTRTRLDSAATDGPELRTSFISENASEGQSLSAYGCEPFNIQTFEDWGSLAQTNVASLFFVTTAFLDLLVEITGGKEGATASVINITSGAGQTKLSFGYVTL